MQNSSHFTPNPASDQTEMSLGSRMPLLPLVFLSQPNQTSEKLMVLVRALSLPSVFALLNAEEIIQQRASCDGANHYWSRSAGEARVTA